MSNEANYERQIRQSSHNPYIELHPAAGGCTFCTLCAGILINSCLNCRHMAGS